MRENADVESVVLFGSIARGDAVPGSDADIAVILRPDSPRAAMRPMDRVIGLIVPFVGVGAGIDLVAFTLAEAMSGTLWASLQKEGMALA